MAHHGRGAAVAIVLLLATACTPASAHTGSMSGGFVGGFAHPLFGPDHVVAMVAVGSQPASALPPNAAQESAGQAQRTADLLEAILLELHVISASIVQLGQPVQDGPDVLRDDINLHMQ